MPFSDEQTFHHQLNFAEANILCENRRVHDKKAFQERLSILQENTADQDLLYSIESLREKIMDLNADEFSQLLKDAESGLVLFPANYVLPNEPNEKF